MDDPTRYTRYLGEVIEVEIDRPLGSAHPLLGFRYPVNYGHLPGTRAGDGDPIDAYVLGFDEPLGEYTGRCVAVILRKDDDEHKLVVVVELVAVGLHEDLHITVPVLQRLCVKRWVVVIQ